MWFITVFQKYIKTNTAPDIGELRTIGYYPHKEMAIEDVLENAIDMNEGMYKYAVIEFIPCGLYQPATKKYFLNGMIKADITLKLILKISRTILETMQLAN